MEQAVFGGFGIAGDVLGAVIASHAIAGREFECGLSFKGIVVRTGGPREAQAEMDAEPSGVMHQGEQKVVPALVVTAVPYGQVNGDATEVDLNVPMLWGGLLGVAGGCREAPVAEGFEVRQREGEQGGDRGVPDLGSSWGHAFRVRGLGVMRVSERKPAAAVVRNWVPGGLAGLPCRRSRLACPCGSG